MKNRYDEVMKHIEVTDEMRIRILNNINNLNLKKASDKRIPSPHYKKYLSIAACFLFLIVGSVIIHDAVNVPSEPPIQVTPDVVSYQSIEELANAIGFTVKEIQRLPFDIESVKYTSYWGDLADIEYVGLDNTVIFRMAISDEDISGYFDEFTDIQTHVVNGANVTIKGHSGHYILAIWQTDDFAYSLQFRYPVSKQEILDTMQSIE